MTTTPGVSLRLKQSLDERGEYGAFTSVVGDILLNQKKIGSIEAIIVHRQRIPRGFFLSACDEHSSDMQYVGCTVYEPTYGRTNLLSLKDYDDLSSGTMYIEEFHLEKEHKDNSDIATTALHKFFHHATIKGNSRRWKVSTAVYILDPIEAMDREQLKAYNAKMEQQDPFALLYGKDETDDDRREKEVESQYMDTLARKDATPFLRNGFFQDEAIARGGNGRIIVASCGHWTKPLLSEEQAETIHFYSAPPMPPTPMGKDAEILQLVITMSTRFGYLDTPMPQEKLRELEAKLVALIDSGGSLGRSYAIHAASTNNSKPIVDLLLQMDPTIVNTIDDHGYTALMGAAESAAGRSTKDGIPETKVIDTLILAGADRDQQDTLGMTAYGHFKRRSAELDDAMNALMGKSTLTSRVHPSHLRVEEKLLPPGGPTESDKSGGKDEGSGFVVYDDFDDCLKALRDGFEGDFDDEFEGGFDDDFDGPDSFADY